MLYFYPKDDTSGCTAEACAFRDALPEFGKVEGAVIGVSRTASRATTGSRRSTSSPSRSPPTRTAWSAGYGAWVEKSMYGRKYMGIERSTFLIDGKGVIRKVWRKVKVPGHVEEVLEAASSLK